MFLPALAVTIAAFELLNLVRAKVENLLHRFFAAARPADLFVLDRFGKKVHPQEWFYVLPEDVSQASASMRDGRSHPYRYDPLQQKIVGRANSQLASAVHSAASTVRDASGAKNSHLML